MGRSTQRKASVGMLSDASPELLLNEIRVQLSESVDPIYRDGQRAFFQHEVDTWGVRAIVLKRIAAKAWKTVKVLPVSVRNQLCTMLWESGKLEEGMIVVYLFERLRKGYGEREFTLFEQWIDRYVNNWAYCDGVSTKLVAAAIANQPGLIAKLEGWTRSSNRWKRRAAAVSLIWEAKRGRHLREIAYIAESLLEDADDLVRKGVGWLLKEAYPAKPAELTSFWEQHAGHTPALVLRIASEKMPRSLVLQLRALRAG